MNNSKIIAGILVICALLLTGLYASADEEPHVGTVKETETSGNYTYLKINEDGKEVWLAVQPMDVSVGDKIEYIGGVPMVDFYSKGLDKTFDSILLITRIKNLSRPAEDDEQQTSRKGYHEDDPLKSERIAAPKSGEIEKAPDGKTVHEIFTESERLKDKEVILRAKVIKVTKNILGKNWITLSDGTGSEPDNKIIALTSDDVQIGDVLTVRGVVKKDVSIGSGYNYKVLIGDAKFAE